MKFDNKVVLVTGGATGIGRAAALEFARRGAKVVIADQNEAAGNETIGELQATGARGLFIQTDVAESAHVERMVVKCVAEFGQLDCAVNNAGVELEWAALADAEESHFDKMIAVNLKGVWLCMRQEIRQMLEQGSGTIVNVASIAGMTAAPNMASYAASKHGVIGLTKTAAVEYAGYGIRINAVCPGVIDTEMTQRAIKKADAGIERSLPGIHPMGRIGTAAEVVAAMMWLVSGAASFTTGAVLPVEGGRLAR